ncbi:MAG: lipase family protein [Trichodesmium sp. ALOHA_ZT_67]|uniref:lipase family protein n=1 Tax=Trichodesmium erythraeum TaxID=1206 RepID=UPI0018C8D298|nr:lipase family protein [Trichodesmium sp. ALOHA_ZT_67]
MSKNNAYWMARISDLTYCCGQDSKPDEEKIIADLKAEDKKFISVTGESKNSSQAILVEHEDYLCMGFRGTDELKDWLDNINVKRKKMLFGKFHAGFANSLKDVWKPLFNKYQELRQKKKRPLFLTGHSLGGSIATVAAARLIHQDLPFISVYTFGQPRTVDRRTARVFNAEAKSRFFRFHNNNDIITRVPSRTAGYSHVGTCVYVTQEITLHVDPGFWFRFVDGIDGVVNDISKLSIDFIADHDMGKYLSAVKSWNLIT